MRIGLDLDEVIYDWYSSAIAELNLMRGHDLVQEDYQPSSWDELEEMYGTKSFERLFTAPEICTRLFLREEPRFGAKVFVERLLKDHNVMVMSHRPAIVRWQTIVKWVREFGEHPLPEWAWPNSTVDKMSYNVDLWIDDSPAMRNVPAVTGKPLLLMDYPHNREVEGKGIYRVKDYTEVLNTIAELENK